MSSFRLGHVLAAPYSGGCWAGVTLYFFRRYSLSVWVALAAIVTLLVYKIAVIGW